MTNALHFKGVESSLPATTNYVEGDVVLVGNKEYVLALNGTSGAKKWNELGDAESHALKSVKVEGDGNYVTGSGTLAADIKLSHKSYTAATAAAVKIGRDAGGHVVLGDALSTASAGEHTHTVTASVPASSFLVSASGDTTKISLNKSSDNFVQSYPGVNSRLVTTSITGTNGTVTASKASASTAVDVAKAVTTVVYAKANAGDTNVGTQISITGVSGSTTASKATAGDSIEVATVGDAVTVATKAATATTVGNANVGTQISITGVSGSTTASYATAGTASSIISAPASR